MSAKSSSLCIERQTLSRVSRGTFTTVIGSSPTEAYESCQLIPSGSNKLASSVFGADGTG